jgi:hypothetical protein
LNDEGKRVWGDVFPDGKVPVRTFFGEVNLEGGGSESVAMVYWKKLSYAQQAAIVNKLVDKGGLPKGALQSRLRLRNEILKDILSIGLPLRESYTTGTVAAELRFFI